MFCLKKELGTGLAFEKHSKNTACSPRKRSHTIPLLLS